ncbi:MAG: choice-of-anchor J domain-containing protein, partial [Prevotella sp.]|nr:choice-of-anchor J domain-containing protein [Prevotella sp.]
AWTTTTFTTPSNCDAPLALNVPAETLMPTTATLAWTGYQDSFEVRYRPAVSYDPIIEETFENGIPSTWTLINNDEDEYNWLAISDIPSTYSYYAEMDLSGWAHKGSDAATSASYVNGIGALTTDQYLITPQLTLNGTLRFFATSTYSDPDTYEVLLSTTGTDIADFTITLQEMGPATYNSWDEVVIDMSAYAGQQGYIAIHHVANDKYFLVIDDFGLYNVVESDWTTVSTDAQFVDIEDLDPETEYEWQVRGENRSCTNGEEDGYTPWSVMGTFTTPGLCDNPNTFTFETLEATTATVNWIGYQDSYNVMYRTAEISEYYFEDWFEEDLSNWTEDNTSASNNIYQVATDINGYVFFVDEEVSGAQTLISTEMDPTTSGTVLEFYTASDGASTYKVGFSSTDNALASFTWSEELTSPDDNYFHAYEGEVPAGTKYFAIQFVSNDNAEGYFIVTAFDVYNMIAEAGEWVELTVNEPSVTMEPLVPETVYEVYVQGICGEEEFTQAVGGYFETPELTTVTQTIALVAGVNWISVNVETDLDALKAALVATGNAPITIQSKDNGLT